ncbi:MAG: phosphatase PAP2 family protein [Acidimicrobiales bacterium]|jgi:undecaprenyl-diphosphatase
MLDEVGTLDRAIYDAVASTPTPALDPLVTWLTDAASYSRMCIAITVALATAGGKRGRGAALRGLTAAGAASVAANLVAKQLVPRERPDRRHVVRGRRARMPGSSSFPSGHTASGSAFAAAVTADFPRLAPFLYGLATLIGYSRIHTGVHYFSDVVGGGLLGLGIGSGIRKRFPSAVQVMA